MKSYGEVLIFLLIFITNMRVFFVKQTHRDPVVALAPLCVLLSIFQIFAWKIDVVTLYTLVLSLMLLFSNFHAMIRFGANLYIDHYSPLMKFWSVITNVLAFTGLAFTIIFMPVEIRNSKLDLHETTTKLQGSFKTGLTPSTAFSENTATIYEYSMYPELKNRQNVVIFMPDKRADTYHYRPYLQLLAKSGFTVCSADFYTDDVKWFHNICNSKYLRRSTLVCESLINNQKFMSQREFYTYNTKVELENLLPLLTEKYGAQCRFFIISDVMGNTAVTDFAKLHPEKISGTFALDSISEYETPGYGMVEGTDPFISVLLGKKPDRSFFKTRYLVLKSSEAIKETILKK